MTAKGRPRPSMLGESILGLAALDRRSKRAILISYDLAAMTLALWGAFSVRLGTFYVPANAEVLVSAAIAFAAGIFALEQLNVYRNLLRYFDQRMVTRIFIGVAVSALAWVIAVYFTRAPSTETIEQGLVPRSVVLIYCGFLFVLLFVGRYLMTEIISAVHGASPLSIPEDDAGKRNVVVYGANTAGIALANSVRRSGLYHLCGFIDDDPALRGQMAAGIPIHAPDALADLVREHGIGEVFLALPYATRAERLAAISRLTELKLKVRTVPAPEEIMSGRFTVSDVRPVDVNDLLRRDPVQPLSELIGEAVIGRTILVTGAGGSIGSEICRQIACAKPNRLVLLDHSEYHLYLIEQQLTELGGALPKGERPELIPVVGSMLNEALVRELIHMHGVDTIYHAAAYKHVPLLEANEVVGVENNVVGTHVMVRAAAEARIDRFTMISTDKAVRPESVMGASKRAAELIVQAYAAQPGCRTRFGIVRFGNVLDSSGSVVQRFREQIRRGGPITVTHSDVTRFFMSIPEATQLVLQASAMAHRGEVFVLDMGEPVRISELARNMITLSGMTVKDDHNPDGDIEIVYIGLRPGEKLYEELFVGDDTAETAHPRIRMAKERFVPLGDLQPELEKLAAAIGAADALAVRNWLRDVILPDEGKLSTDLRGAVSETAGDILEPARTAGARGA